ncbi:unnamed protein product [Rhizophagus irregularis]|nr:unnamed protein product [Rhizophagus irregularis]
MDLLIFQQNVQEKYPEEVGLLTPPYEEEASVERKILVTYNCLQRSIKLKSRILALENAYFVGKLLAEEESYSKRFLLKKSLTKHYQTMVENTYDIFEYNSFQILRTKYLNVQDIRRMKRTEVLYLRDCLIESFAGAQN